MKEKKMRGKKMERVNRVYIMFGLIEIEEKGKQEVKSSLHLFDWTDRRNKRRKKMNYNYHFILILNNFCLST